MRGTDHPRQIAFLDLHFSSSPVACKLMKPSFENSSMAECSNSVIPAKAGIQAHEERKKNLIPA